MEADAKTFQDILAGDHRYIVPPYQRPYVWEQDRQWKPMWDDIIATVERLSRARWAAHLGAEPAATADQQVSPHFLGAVVLEQLPSASGDLGRRAVVDGQQRLTTIQLLIRGLLDALDDQSGGSLRQERARLRKMIRNDEDIVTDKESLHKLSPRRAERNRFMAAMDDEHSDAVTDRFAAARAFFRQQAKAWINDPDACTDPFVEDDVTGRAQLLSGVVRTLLKLVVIDLESVDDAQVIFEVLNARNTPLTAADLVKNLLFMRAENDKPNSIEGLYDRYWKPFDDDPWWVANVGTGHAARQRLDRFLGDFLIAQTGSLVNLSHLYGAARDWILQSGKSVEGILGELRHYAEAYRLLQLRDEEGLSGKEVRSLRNIHTLKVVAADPLLLWLLTLEPSELSHPDREQCIQMLEAFLVRRMATKWQTRAYGSVFAEVLNEVQNGGSAIKDSLTNALARGPHGCSWPSDYDIEHSFVNTRAYGAGGMNQPRLRLLLGEVERNLITSSGKTESLYFDYDALQIEHLMPQKWRQNWPVDGETREAREIQCAQRDQYIHRIGNLTLLTHALNPSVTNAAWPDKRRELEKHSMLRINQPLLQKTSWDEADIEERGRWLAAEVSKVWPLPADTETGTEAYVDAPDEDELGVIHLELLERAEGATTEGARISLSAVGYTLAELGLIDSEGADEAPLVRQVVDCLIRSGQMEVADNGSYLVIDPEQTLA